MPILISRRSICVSKFRHAAFHANLIGIDADYRIHVSEAPLAMHDGPMLEQAIKALASQSLRLPKHMEPKSDRERLALRFEALRKAT